MNFRPINHRLLALAVLASGLGLSAAETPASGGKAAAAVSGGVLDKLTQKINAQRDAMIAEHEKLANQYRTASEEQRKVLRAQMEAQQKDFIEAQRAMMKQIRDEMHKIRQGAVPGR